MKIQTINLKKKLKISYKKLIVYNEIIKFIKNK